MIRTTVFSAGAKTNLARSAWLAWSVAALFYAYEFFQRLAPSAMESALTHSLALSAEAFGSLGACYFYAYAIAQLPTGLLFDNYGIKRTLIGASLLVALGSLLFALAPGLWLAQLARVLVGLGSAFAFLGCLQIARAGFSEQWLPIVIGLTNSLGIVGALFAEKPLTAFIAATDWRVTMLAAALFGVLLTGLMIMGLGSQQLRQTTASPGLKLGWQRLANQLMKVLANPLSWIVALIAALRVVPVISFGELWAPAFFRQSFAIDPQAAATIVSFLFIGIGVGGPVNGWLANYLGRYNWLLITGLGSLVGLLLILYPPLTSLWWLKTLLFAQGFFASGMLLSFSINSELNSADVQGTVMAFTNMLIMVLGGLFQFLVGWILDLQSHDAATQLKFNLADFQHALVIIPLAVGLSIMLNLLLIWLKKPNT